MHVYACNEHCFRFVSYGDGDEEAGGAISGGESKPRILLMGLRRSINMSGWAWGVGTIIVV